jgi:hypothetical protein
MSSKKKGGSHDVVQMIFSFLTWLARTLVTYFGRFCVQILQNIIWIFRETPGANNDFSDYCRTNFGSAPATWVKVCVGILLSPLVLTALVFWSAIRAI